MSVIAELFEKISHPTRLKILNLLQDNPMNFSQLKAALNIESNGNLDHHLKKLDTLIFLDAGGLYKLSDDGKEAIQAVQVMEASIKPKEPTTAKSQGTKVFYAFAAITCTLPIFVGTILFASAYPQFSPAEMSLTLSVLIVISVGLLAAVLGFRRTIKADTQSTEPLTYFPSGKDPWNQRDWLRNVGFFGSYLLAFFSLVYIELSPIDFPGKIIWVVLSLLALMALGFTSQSLIYSIIEKANSRIRSSQTSKNTTT